jgi:hypothetical protein
MQPCYSLGDVCVGWHAFSQSVCVCIHTYHVRNIRHTWLCNCGLVNLVPRPPHPDLISQPLSLGGRPGYEVTVY